MFWSSFYMVAQSFSHTEERGNKFSAFNKRGEGMKKFTPFWVGGHKQFKTRDFPPILKPPPWN